MSEFTEAEMAKLKPLQAGVDASRAEVQRAAVAHEAATKAYNAHAAKIAALGGEPQPADYETAAAWQAAHSEHRFELAKLQPGLVPLANDLTAAEHAMQSARMPMSNAQAILDHAVVQIFADRYDVIAAQIVPAAVRFMSAKRMLAPGFNVDWPKGFVCKELPFGMANVGFSLNIDLAAVQKQLLSEI